MGFFETLHLNRRRFLFRGGAAAAVAALHGHALPALAAHRGDAGDEAAAKPLEAMHPFGENLVLYDQQKKMADKVRMMAEIPRLTHHWKGIARRFGGLDRLGQMKAVNVFVNKVPYVRDIDLKGKADFWVDPVHFFGEGGDCEEFALAKYSLLLHLGFHPDRLMVLAMARHRDMKGHAVLGVGLGGEVFILDQLRDDVVVDALYRGYSLVYSIGAKGVQVPA